MQCHFNHMTHFSFKAMPYCSKIPLLVLVSKFNPMWLSALREMYIFRTYQSVMDLSAGCYSSVTIFLPRWFVSSDKNEQRAFHPKGAVSGTLRDYIVTIKWAKILFTLLTHLPFLLPRKELSWVIVYNLSFLSLWASNLKTEWCLTAYVIGPFLKIESNVF